MKIYFSLSFLWIGIGFSGINNGNYVGAVLFSIPAILLFSVFEDTILLINVIYAIFILAKNRIHE